MNNIFYASNIQVLDIVDPGSVLLESAENVVMYVLCNAIYG